jgi:outer membrane protein assembly factor BamB
VSRLVSVLALALLLAGCNTLGKSNREPPTPLKPITSTATFSQLWTVSLAPSRDRYSRLGVVLAGNRIYAADAKGNVVALDAANGKTLWRTALNLPVSGATGFGDGLVLVGASNGVVAALEADSGKVRWRKAVSSEVLAPPAAAAGTVVVQSVDGAVVGLAAKDGSERWKFQRTVPALSLRGTSHPTIYDKKIVAAGLANGTVVLLDLNTGNELREFTVSQPSGRTELERLVDVDGTPVTSANGLFAGSYQGNVIAVDINSGRMQWSHKLSSYLPMAISGARLVVVDENDSVHQLDAATGADQWTQAGLRYRELCAPAIVGPYVVVGDAEGYLHALSLADGKFAARLDLKEKAIETVTPGSAGVVYVRTRAGKLTALRLNPK